MALASIDIEKYLKLVPVLKSAGKNHIEVSYDLEANVLYVNFHVSAKAAADSELTDKDVIVRYDELDEIIGLTILHASKR